MYFNCYIISNISSVHICGIVGNDFSSVSANSGPRSIFFLESRPRTAGPQLELSRYSITVESQAYVCVVAVQWSHACVCVVTVHGSRAWVNVATVHGSHACVHSRPAVRSLPESFAIWFCIFVFKIIKICIPWFFNFNTCLTGTIKIGLPVKLKIKNCCLTCRDSNNNWVLKPYNDMRYRFHVITFV